MKTTTIYFTKGLVAQESAPRDFFLQKIQKIVEGQLEKDITIEALAKQVFISRVQLYRKIKAMTGLSPSQFIEGIRLSKAAQLLKHSPLSISEIAYDVGFSDPKYFSRQFVKAFGKTPSTFRNK